MSERQESLDDMETPEAVDVETPEARAARLRKQLEDLALRMMKLSNSDQYSKVLNLVSNLKCSTNAKIVKDFLKLIKSRNKQSKDMSTIRKNYRKVIWKLKIIADEVNGVLQYIQNLENKDIAEMEHLGETSMSTSTEANLPTTHCRRFKRDVKRIIKSLKDNIRGHDEDLCINEWKERVDAAVKIRKILIGESKEHSNQDLESAENVPATEKPRQIVRRESETDTNTNLKDIKVEVNKFQEPGTLESEMTKTEAENKGGAEVLKLDNTDNNNRTNKSNDTVKKEKDKGRLRTTNDDLNRHEGCKGGGAKCQYLELSIEHETARSMEVSLDQLNAVVRQIVRRESESEETDTKKDAKDVHTSLENIKGEANKLPEPGTLASELTKTEAEKKGEAGVLKLANIDNDKRANKSNDTAKKEKDKGRTRAMNEDLNRANKSNDTAKKEKDKGRTRAMNEDLNRANKSNDTAKKEKDKGRTRAMNEDLNRRIEELEDKAKRQANEIEKEKRKNQDLSNKLDRQIQQTAAEQKAKEEALVRLSEITSLQLRNNNPNIVDLSDPNRPTKIGEQLSELYDTEWTDAFEELSEQRSEQEAMIILRDILMDAHKKCLDLSSMERIFEKIKTDFLQCPLKIDVELRQKLIDLRKQSVVQSLDTVIQKVRSSFLSIYSHAGPKLVKFIDGCAKLCWFMAVQDPPLHLYNVHSKEFDKGKYKEYTEKGKYTAFIVWPAVCLHEGGPILSKGIAQGSEVPVKYELPNVDPKPEQNNVVQVSDDSTCPRKEKVEEDTNHSANNKLESTGSLVSTTQESNDRQIIENRDTRPVSTTASETSVQNESFDAAGYVTKGINDKSEKENDGRTSDNREKNLKGITDVNSKQSSETNHAKDKKKWESFQNADETKNTNEDENDYVAKPINSNEPKGVKKVSETKTEIDGKFKTVIDHHKPSEIKSSSDNKTRNNEPYNLKTDREAQKCINGKAEEKRIEIVADSLKAGDDESTDL